MDSPSARRIIASDYALIRAALSEQVSKRQRTGRKALYPLIDIDECMKSIYDFNDAYIVADSFLVIYAVDTPWYSAKLFLHELLVLRVYPGASFSVVPRFLEAAARASGAVIVCAGTALAKSDTALAALYSREGFAEAGIMLTKEI